jgi:hypothetical protein
MREICGLCEWQRADGLGGAECSKAEYRDDEHGHFKEGCFCIHDSDLGDFFQKSVELDNGVEKDSAHMQRLRDKISKLSDENIVLKSRLTTIKE